MHISNWSASRSGAAMTVSGTDDTDGSKIKLAVSKIEARDGRVVALDRSGTAHILRVA